MSPTLNELLAASFTLILVETDDTHILGEVLNSLIEDQGPVYAMNYKAGRKEGRVFWQVGGSVNTDVLAEMSAHKKTLIIANYEGEIPQAYKYGPLDTPEELIKRSLLGALDDVDVETVLTAVRGLSYTRAKQLIRLAVVRNLPITLKEYKALRHELYGVSEGLYTVEGGDEAYIPDPNLGKWFEANKTFFFDNSPELAPRGILLEGVGGTGKTLFAKHASKDLNAPLYRLDIGSSMSRWQGESEENIRRHLTAVENNAPCILLLDEVEKALATSDSEVSSSRILAYLLWWLAEHRSKVFTVMTTNDKSRLPPELYRPGRCDEVFKLQPLTSLKAKKAIIQAWVLSWYQVKDIAEDTDAEHLYSLLKNDFGENTEPQTPAEIINFCRSHLRKYMLEGVVKFE